MDHSALISRAADEIKEAASRADQAELALLLDEITSARRVFVHGVGREGLMMKALAMRLFHLGLDAHLVGAMTTPPVARGDLLFVSAGPGEFPTIHALVRIAGSAGARTACVTAQPTGEVPKACDTVLSIPAQTMADDQGSAVSSVLPMGSLFEGAQYLIFECLVLALRDRLGVSAEAMRANHTNLE